MYIVVTGAAGFIGSNIVRALSERDEHDLLAVDDLRQGDKFVNLVDCDIADYLDQQDFLGELRDGAFDGAIPRSRTTAHARTRPSRTDVT